MPDSPACQASAVLRAALRAGADDARTGAILALLLALLARIFAGSDAAWSASPEDDEEYDDCGFDTVAFRDPSLHARPIHQPQIGRAPHDIHVECGQVPGYVMAGVHNLGMGAMPAPARAALRKAPARAPP